MKRLLCTLLSVAVATALTACGTRVPCYGCGPEPTPDVCAPNPSTQSLDLSEYPSPDALAIVAANTANSPMPALTATTESLLRIFLAEGNIPSLWSATGAPEAMDVTLQEISGRNTLATNKLRVNNNVGRISEALAAPPGVAGMSLFEGIGLAADALRSEAADSKWIVVIGSGLDDTGSMSMGEGRLLQDPNVYAERVASENPALDLHGMTILLQTIGYTAPPQPTPSMAQRDIIRSVWETTLTQLGATVIVDSFPASPCSVPTDQPVAVTELPGLEVKCSEEAVTFQVPGAVLFDGDSGTLREGAVDELVQPVALMLESPLALAEIVGHTASSSRYTAAELEALSILRAEAVRDVFLSAGIDASRLTAIGVGDTQPLAEDIGPDGRQNEFAAAERRVTVTMTEVTTCPGA